MVKYCNATCKKKHRKKHKKKCEERVAELHDEALFKEVESKECPICYPSLLRIEHQPFNHAVGRLSVLVVFMQ